jgi:tRNA1Val (adenine37-N6)-methyltransferase
MLRLTAFVMLSLSKHRQNVAIIITRNFNNSRFIIFNQINLLPNQYFQFKKFIVQQDKCSMKVCTDSCLFGAWIALIIERKDINPKSILDIGAGTGLLSLMLAQKNNARIDAVEIDTNAFEQATQNINVSPWHERIKVFNNDIKKWNATLKYDLIITNPPFYENDLISEDERKNISKHGAALSLEELIAITKNLLNNDGSFAVLLPWQRTNLFENLALKHFLFVKEKIEVKQRPSHNYFRTILILQKQKTVILNKELTIKNNDKEYSNEFKDLLKDYYLYL